MQRSIPLLLATFAVGACQRSHPPQAESEAPEIVFGPGVLIETPAFTIQDFTLTERGNEALELLMKAEMFTTDAVGFAGVLPDEVIALRRLVAESDAAAALAYIEQNATTAGRLFALVGLRSIDRARFDELLGYYRTTSTTVDFMTGCCILPGTPVKDIVDKGDRAPQLKDGQSLQEWYDEHGSYDLDIAGGGWTNLLLEDGGYATPQDVYPGELDRFHDQEPSDS